MAAAQRRYRFRAAATALIPAASLILAATGCSGGSGPDASSGARREGQASAEAGTATTAAATAASSADVVDPAERAERAEISGRLELPAEPVATVPSNRPGLELEVWAVSRADGTATLAFAVTNRSTGPYGMGGELATNGIAGDVSGVSLVDAGNLKRYLVLLDPEGGCVCSLTDGVAMDPGGSAFFYATFTAPPPDVTRITVETPMGTVAGVPITDV